MSPHRPLAFVLLFVAGAAAAVEPSPVFEPWKLPARVADAGDFVPAGVRQESVLSGDFDGDGREDRAMVLRDDERRRLLVALYGVGALDPYPLGEASLSAPRGVLVIEDLAGGTTAIQSTYRYRYDKATDRMRLIGDDVSLYSRTWQHGTTKVSTNRLTGKRITTVNDLVGEPGPNAKLGPDKETASKVPTEPKIFLGEAPTPEATLGMDAG